MDWMKEADFRKEIKKSPAGSYLFFGDEDYLKVADLQLARQVICPDETFAVFNEIVFDALDFSADKLEDALMAPPMMAERKLIVVRGLDFKAMKPSDLDALVSVCTHTADYDFNVLIISVSSGAIDPGYLPKKPSAVLTKLASVLRPVYFERCSPAQLSAWVSRHYAAAGVEASPEIASATVARCGRDMFSLASEIEKIAFYALSNGRRQITREDVELVGIPAEEFDSFAFSNAILERRSDDALRILADMKLRRVEPLSALSEIVRVWCDLAAVRAMTIQGLDPDAIASVLKMHSYKVKIYARQAALLSDDTMKRAIRTCQSADLAMKSGSGQNYRQLELLICSL